MPFCLDLEIAALTLRYFVVSIILIERVFPSCNGNEFKCFVTYQIRGGSSKIVTAAQGRGTKGRDQILFVNFCSTILF